MIKFSLITLFSSIALFFSAVFADGVVIDHNLPANLNPGEKTIVSVNVNKGEVTGFAKLQLEIPAGLTARAIKKSGASFTFSGQKAKFIWMTLPDTQEFQVEYELEANTNVNGSKVIEGQFSYIKENERVDYDLSPQIINIGDVLVDNSSGTEDNNTSSNSTTQGSDVISTRIMTPMGNGEYFIELTTENVTTDGFAKIIEEVSTGFEIKEDSSGESIATIEDNTIKFVWFEKPSDSSYNVTYTIVGNESATPTIDGKFSYVMDNQPLEVPVVHQEMISSRDFSGGEDLAETPAESTESTTEENSTETDNVVNSENTESTADNSTTTKSEKNVGQGEEDNSVADNSSEVTPEITNAPQPEYGVNYKVQLAATHKYIGANTFKKSHGFTDEIQTENHEGWTKFVTGTHSEYKSARDARNSINSEFKKLKGPFVTAYNNGERITVQEALMVSKQKWYQ